MKIVIADGRHEADYLIGMYKSKENELIVINNDESFCKYLSKKNHINVYKGKATKEFALRSAGINDADLFISLASRDVDSYVSCKMAKLIFNCKRCIATVINPKNVDLFKELGVDSVVSSTYLLAESIKAKASVEELIRTLSVEDDKIAIFEMIIKEDFNIVNKTLKEIKFPATVSVSCVYRTPHVIIPNGNTKLLANDKVLFVTTKENQDAIIKLISTKAQDAKG